MFDNETFSELWHLLTNFITRTTCMLERLPEKQRQRSLNRPVAAVYCRGQESPCSRRVWTCGRWRTASPSDLDVSVSPSCTPTVPYKSTDHNRSETA